MSLSRFSHYVVGLSVSLGLVVRVRIITASAMPPAQPVSWLLAGLAEDLVVGGLLACIVWLIFRRLPRVGAVLLAAALLAMLIGQYALSVAVIFFGHPLRGEEFETEIHPQLFIGSATGLLLGRILVLMAVYLIGVIVAWRRAHRSGTPPMNVRYIAAAFAIPVLVAPIAAWGTSVETAENAFVAGYSILREPRIYEGAGPPIPKPIHDLRLARELAGAVDPHEFYDDDYPLARRRPKPSPRIVSLPPGVKPNVVFITLEGLRAEETGVYGNNPPGITPNLDLLAREGIRVDRAYSVGRYTPEGELGIWYGVPASAYEVVMRSRSRLKVTGIPEILRAAGWRSNLWMHDGDQRLYLAGRFFRAHGIRVIDGRDFPHDDPSTSWGYSDRALMRHAVDAFDHLEPPFTAMLMTVSNHHPFKLPPDALEVIDTGGGLQATLGKQNGRLLQTEHYTDEALGEFFERARTRPWFHNTIFVICSDHGSAVAPFDDRPVNDHRLFELVHRVPLIFYSPLLPGGKVIAGPASQCDILPTILGLLNLDLPRAAIGRDLFAETPDPKPPVIAWSWPPRELTIATGPYVYHALIGSDSSQPSQEILVDDVADPDGHRNIADVKPDTIRYCRRMGMIFLDVYQWLLANDRAGVRTLQ